MFYHYLILKCCSALDFKSLQNAVSLDFDVEVCSSKINYTSIIEKLNNTIENWTLYWTSFHRRHVLKWTEIESQNEFCCKYIKFRTFCLI